LREAIRRSTEERDTLLASIGEEETEDLVAERASRLEAVNAQLHAHTHSLEAVQHLLALSLYHGANSTRRGGGGVGSAMAIATGNGGMGGGGLSSASAAAAAAGLGGVGAGGGGGGAGYAYELLKDCHRLTEDNQFFFALCCFELGKYTEAEHVLLSFATAPVSESDSQSGKEGTKAESMPPKASQGLLLLGRICHRSNRFDDAGKYYSRCLASDPLCWTAFQALASLGVLDSSVLGSKMFKVESKDLEESVSAADGVVDGAAELQPTSEVDESQLAAGIPRSGLLNSSNRRFLGSRVRSLTTPAPTAAAAASMPNIQMLSLTTPSGPRGTLFATPNVTGGMGVDAIAATPSLQTPPRGRRSAATRDLGIPSAPRYRSSTNTTNLSKREMSTTGTNTTTATRSGTKHGRSRSHTAPSLSASPSPSPQASPRGSPTPTSPSPSPSSSSVRSSTRRTVAARSAWESSEKRGVSSSTAGASSGYSSDDAGHASERERNERKVGRRMGRLATGEKQPKTPRLGDRTTTEPTTPRRAAAAAAAVTAASRESSLMSARKTPATRRGVSTSSMHMAAPSKKRLPEIAEAATPDSTATSSAQATPAGIGVGQGMNLIHSLQTPSNPASSLMMAPTPATSNRTHVRTRSLNDELMEDIVDVDDEQVHDEDEGLMSGGDCGAAAGGVAGMDAEDAAARMQQLLQMQQEQQQKRLEEAANYLTQLLQTIAEAVRLQNLYQCSEALSILSHLPPHHAHTPSILSLSGRCYFELHSYVRSIECYSEARVAQPCGSVWTQGMEYYSTALWHRSAHSQLSHLAQSLLSLDPGCAEGWIALGNCFSLQSEHDIALKFFRRAIQCNPFKSYAYTLAAHEYLANEELERAIIGYRRSLSIDPRAYNAWYGLGSLFLRQEKYALSLYHFQRALQIHPRSPVLHAYVGCTLANAGRTEEALEAFRKAEALEMGATAAATTSTAAAGGGSSAAFGVVSSVGVGVGGGLGQTGATMSKFQLARVHMMRGEYDEAMKYLQLLAQMVPRETQVHLLMGKIHKKKGNLDAAMYCFVTALDLDPKDRTAIKAAIDHLHSNLDDDDDEAQLF